MADLGSEKGGLSLKSGPDRTDEPELSKILTSLGCVIQHGMRLKANNLLYEQRGIV